MQQIQTALGGRLWLRVVILLTLLLPVALFALPADIRQLVLLKAAYYSPWVLVPSVIGAVVGWLAYSWAAFFYTVTIVLVAQTALALLGSLLAA